MFFCTSDLTMGQKDGDMTSFLLFPGRGESPAWSSVPPRQPHILRRATLVQLEGQLENFLAKHQKGRGKTK